MKYDIIFLNETWSKGDCDFTLNGYTYLDYPRKSRSKNALRASGGIGIFIRNSVYSGVKFHKIFEDIIVWIRLKKEFFSFDKDVYIANVYFVPESSV